MVSRPASASSRRIRRAAADTPMTNAKRGSAALGGGVRQQAKKEQRNGDTGRLGGCIVTLLVACGVVGAV